MAREQLLARSISRLVWKYEKKDINALKVLRGYSWTDEEAEAIGRAAERYKTDIARNFIYNPDTPEGEERNNIDTILKTMEAETARIKAQGKPAPLICIDYLQMITTPEKDAIEGLKKAIKRLKDFAIDNSKAAISGLDSTLVNNSGLTPSGTSKTFFPVEEESTEAFPGAGSESFL